MESDRDRMRVGVSEVECVRAMRRDFLSRFDLGEAVGAEKVDGVGVVSGQSDGRFAWLDLVSPISARRRRTSAVSAATAASTARSRLSQATGGVAGIEDSAKWVD